MKADAERFAAAKYDLVQSCEIHGTSAMKVAPISIARLTPDGMIHFGVSVHGSDDSRTGTYSRPSILSAFSAPFVDRVRKLSPTGSSNGSLVGYIDLGQPSRRACLLQLTAYWYSINVIELAGRV